MIYKDEEVNPENSKLKIPLWLKILTMVFSIGLMSVFIRAQMVEQSFLLGFPRERIVFSSLILFILSVLLVVAVWFFEDSLYSQFLYWVLRFFREHILVLSLLGIVYLITIRAPLLSLRGGILYGICLVILWLSISLQPVRERDELHPSLVSAFAASKKLISRVGSSSTLVWSVVAVLLPGTIVLFIINVILGSHLSNYGPYSFWNDEVAYWAWLRSFAYVGLNSGYNAPNEILAPFEFSRYGEASPFYIYIYGGIARLLDWFPALPIVVNMIIISIAILLFLRSIKLNVWQIIFVCLMIVSSWPVLIYLPLTTHETLNQAIGIIFAIFFIKLLSQKIDLTFVQKLGLILLVYFATLIRLSWGLLLFPVLLYCVKGPLLKRLAISISFGGVLYLSAIVILGYFIPPLNNSIMDTFRGGLQNGLWVFGEKFQQQIFFMFRFKELNPNIGISFQMLVITLWSTLTISRSLWKSRTSVVSVVNDFSFFNFYNMTSLLFSGFMFYLQEGFYRTFAPTILITYLIYVFKKDYRRLSVLVMLNVIFLSSYLNFYAHVGDFQIIKTDYTKGSSGGEQLQREIAQYVRYDRNATNPWCNTLLIPLDYYDSRLMWFPPGIGFSYILKPSTFQLPIKSKYILFDPETYKDYQDSVRFKLLDSLYIGDLYLNLDADCSDEFLQ